MTDQPYGPWGAGAALPTAIGDPWDWLERANTTPFSGSGLVSGRRCLVNGFSMTEFTGTASAAVQLIAGTSASGVNVATINLAPNESAREYIPWPFILFKYGLFVVVSSGLAFGSVSFLTPPDS